MKEARLTVAAELMKFGQEKKEIVFLSYRRLCVMCTWGAYVWLCVRVYMGNARVLLCARRDTRSSASFDWSP